MKELETKKKKKKKADLDDLLECDVPYTTQRYSVYCHRRVKKIFNLKKLESEKKIKTENQSI